MSAPTPNDGSEDVNDFLQRIKELGDKRDQEDEERNRLLEEEILKGRAERQARRAERARSISPTKSSPANTPVAARISTAQANTMSQSPKMDIGSGSEARPEVEHEDAMEKLTGGSISPMKENISPIDSGREIGELDNKRDSSAKSSPSSAMPSRNSTLSWQRRPTSQSSDRPRSRPLSMVASENAARSPRTTGTPEPSTSTEPTLSREQIAQSLASKDPAWFRQTADRGIGSPAYRRNQVEDEDRSDHASTSARIQMPGMSQNASGAEKAVEDPVDRSSSPSRTTTLSGSGSRGSYQASPKISSGFGSPMPLTPAQRFEPPADSKSEGRGLAMSPTQGRISPERLDRPPSPTKGMGGFVQSAMMKRSDSVSKRWSVQSPTGLSRGNSVASRVSVDLGNGTSLSNIANAIEPRTGSKSRENSPHPLSRPSSSHSNATLTQERPGTANSMKSTMTTSTTSTSNDVFIKPALPASRIQTPTSFRADQQDDPEATPKRPETPPPSSPSKTMDPRRWSPTKSSWLESALNKPESPKPKAAAPVPQQPAWMKQKGSVDLLRSPTSASKHEVSIGGLMRSPPPGPMKQQSLGAISSGFSPMAKSVFENKVSQENKGPSKFSEPSAATTPSSTSLPKSPPVAGKVKPETPPKKDFRANLKPREVSSGGNNSNEPEFKNVFGQLKRTKTQNYVAPDELKNNITRGKAALNITGGPKKTERKDEFKEAILKKKEDFKKAQIEGKGITRSTSGGVQESPVPEALAKRQALGRSGSNASELSAQGTSSRPQSFSDSPMPTLTKETSAPGRLQAKEPSVGKLAGRLNPGLAGLLARGPPSMASDTSRSSSPAQSQRTASLSTSTRDPEEPGPQLTHMTKGRARGPRRKAPSTTPAATTPTPAASKSAESKLSSPDAREEIAAKGPESVPLSPRKRALTLIQIKVADAAPTSTSKADIENSGSQPSSPRKLDMKRRSQFLQEASKAAIVPSQLEAPKPLSPTKANPSEITMKSQEPPEAKAVPATKPKPSTPQKPPASFPKASDESPKPAADSPETAKLRPAPLSLSKPAIANQTPTFNGSQTSNRESPIKSVTSAQSPVVSVKNAAAQWSRPSQTKATQDSPRVRSPIKLPTQADENAAMVGAGLRSASPDKPKEPAGSGTSSFKPTPSARPLPTPPTKGPLSPPSSAGLGPPQSPTKIGNSPIPQTSEATNMIGAFFTGSKTGTPDFKADTATLLSTRPDQGTDVRTLRSSLYQLSSDGKKQVVPSHQERILFEGNLYLCTHTFGNPAGKRVTEVYFWVGDEVSSSTVEDAEIFARREAKSASGKLITLRQGKESPEFFHALGGIVITRRGSSNKYDSLAPHILCGRKHFGQIAFDEVDFAPDSLCSGFPYLISTPSGKSYLWKGKGSGIEELSCARLIGMDFGLTGEIEEVEDGNEHASFLQIFGSGAQIPKSADHWKLKSNYNKYCVRLFKAESGTREQVTEISPFCWQDLDAKKIYILDAFFEIYIIVGSAAQSQYASFQNALMFAQEFGILAAGMEDRPYVPVTTVVLEGVPKDMKSVFRKWVPGRAPTLHKPMSPTGGIKRMKSLRVLPLTAALEATRR
ncbi:uncharacterized protein PAC_04177 [Phialocephala subalpina]|uniref:DUF4045 domain-containing protein n=1 Tax=Phialocephala subalpina TaxID=576137 RepID=A0A1L7WNE7_9HELO|nr:uncharacterized protein PAC_04177 [Phialocephala subalpina]